MGRTTVIATGKSAERLTPEMCISFLNVLNFLLLLQRVAGIHFDFRSPMVKGHRYYNEIVVLVCLFTMIFFSQTFYIK